MPEAQDHGEVAGALAPGVLPGLLREIYLGRKTGMLQFAHREDRGAVCFIDGKIVFVGSNIEECLIGETFIRHGLIDREQLERALELSSRSRRRLGQSILELGFMSRDALDRGLALHVREILMSLFSWTRGSYVFEAQAPEALRAFDRAPGHSTAEAILDAVWSVADHDVIRSALGDLDRVLVRTTDPLLKFQRVELTESDKFLLSRVDGKLSANEVITLAATGREEAERRLFGLLCIGTVEFGSYSPRQVQALEVVRRSVSYVYDHLADLDDRQILGVPRDATPAQIEAAYERLLDRFHPDVHHSSPLADLREELAAIFARVDEAYRKLSATVRDSATQSTATPRARPSKPGRD